jgi:hypothetical protein
VFITGELGIVQGSVNKADLADARALTGTDEAARHKAETRLNDCGVSPDDVLARARQVIAEDMDIHNTALANLEQRRYRLRNELERRQASRGSAQVEDAEFVIVEGEQT